MFPYIFPRTYKNQSPVFPFSPSPFPVSAGCEQFDTKHEERKKKKKKRRGCLLDASVHVSLALALVNPCPCKTILPQPSGTGVLIFSSFSNLTNTNERRKNKTKQKTPKCCQLFFSFLSRVLFFFPINAKRWGGGIKEVEGGGGNRYKPHARFKNFKTFTQVYPIQDFLSLHSAQ